jgi:putative hemolysin
MNNPGRFSLRAILILLALALLSGCGLVGSNTPTPYPENTDGEEDPFIGIPNPASFYCQEMGYQLEMRENQQGTEGICIFPNSTECEEWEFLAGGCAQEWTFCQRQGYSLQEGEGMATCVFPDGSSCPEYDLFIGECKPPQ